LKNFSK